MENLKGRQRLFSSTMPPDFHLPYRFMTFRPVVYRLGELFSQASGLFSFF